MNIVNILSKQNVTFTLKYFGINDMATVHDIEIILNNHECILRYFKQFKHYNIDTIDDFINYLAVLKFCEIEDVIPQLISSEHKKIFIKFTSEIEPILKKYNNRDVIRFINTNIKYIFEEQTKYYEIETKTIELCAEYQKAISDDVIVFFIENHPFILLSNYDKFHKKLERNETHFLMIFSEKTLENIQYSVNEVLDILASIYKRNKKMYDKLDSFINFIINYHEDMMKNININNVIRYDNSIHKLYKFLINVKHLKANKFAEYLKKIDSLIDEYLNKYGHNISYEIPIKNVQELINCECKWEYKLLYITHVYTNNSRRKWVSILDFCPQKEKNIIDLVSTNVPTNSYFTFSHQRNLRFILIIGGLSMHLILIDNKMFLELESTLSKMLKKISIASGYYEESLEEDIKLLFQMLKNIFYFDIDDKNIIQSLCYGTAMYICAFVEKLLRTIYIALKQNEIYIPVNKTTLGYLLSDGVEPFTEIFGEYQLKHLRFLFCTDKDNDVGYNYRNKLAHWNNINKRYLNIKLVEILFYLLTTIIASLYVYFELLDENIDDEIEP